MGNWCEGTYLALMISMASSKFSTATIGMMGPKISLRHDVGMPSTCLGQFNSLGHKSVIKRNSTNDCRGNISRQRIRFPARNDSSLGVVQQFFESSKVSIGRGSDKGFLRRPLGEEFQNSDLASVSLVKSS